MQDCIVIGAGIIGLTTAKTLADFGLNVTLVDHKPSHPIASWAGGGILSPLYPWLYPEAVNQLALWSLEHYFKLEYALKNHTGIDIEINQCGLLICGVEHSNELTQWQNNTPLTILPPEKAMLEKLNLTQAERHIFLPDIANVRNPRLLAALKAYVAQHPKIEFIENTLVQSISIQNKHCYGITSSRGIHKAQNTVITAGPWSKQLLPENTLCTMTQPVKGQMLAIKAQPGLLKTIVLAKGKYLIPRNDGLILVGSTCERSDYDATTSNEAKQTLLTFAYQLMPALTAYPITHHWSGLRPGSDYPFPFIGPIPNIRNLYINTGHFRNGIILAPASACIIKEIITDQIQTFDPTPFAIKDKNE